MVIQPSAEMIQAIHKYRNGDKQAFDVIYNISLPYLSKCILNVINRTAPGASETLLQDILQDTYMTIAEKIDTLQNEEAFFQWAGQIATNHALRTWNKSARHMEMEQSQDESLYEIPDEQFIPEDILENKKKQRLIRQMLQELPTGQYLCLVEYFYNGLKETEIAEKLDMPLGTVKTNLFRAKKKLKQIVQSHEKKHGVKLYSMSWLLMLLFWEDIKEVFVGTGVALVEAAGSASAAGTGAAATGTVGTVSGTGAVVATGLGVKIAAVVAAVAVLVGATLGVNTLIHKTDSKKDSPFTSTVGDNVVEEGLQALTLVVSSSMGEQWDGEYTYRLEDTGTNETVVAESCRGEVDLKLQAGQYTLIVDAPRHRTFQKQITAGRGNDNRIYIHMTSDGSWLSHVDIARLANWLQYLGMPIGTQDVPSLFVNDGSAENTQIILRTLENAIPCEAREPSILIYSTENEQSVLVRGRAFAEQYTKELFGYIPENGIAEDLLQIPETEEQTYYVSQLISFEQLDNEQIRVWVNVHRSVFLAQGDILHSTGKGDSYCIVATLRYSEDCTMNWTLESAACYTPDQQQPLVEHGQLLEASQTDNDAYTQLIDEAVDVRDWDKKGIVTLTEEQRARMERVLLYTAYAHSGQIERQFVAGFGAFLADVELEKYPFLKVTDPAEGACNVLLMLAWNKEEVLNVRRENGNRCGGSGVLSYDLATAEALITGIFGEVDLSVLEVNVIMKGYNTEISDGRLYQPEFDVYNCQGKLNIDEIERTDSGIRIYATYSAGVTLSCIYEAVENPDSYLGYTLTGVSYTFA